MKIKSCLVPGDIDATVIIRLGRAPRHNDVDALTCKKLDVKFHVGFASMKLENLFGGDGDLGNYISISITFAKQCTSLNVHCLAKVSIHTSMSLDLVSERHQGHYAFASVPLLICKQA